VAVTGKLQGLVERAVSDARTQMLERVRSAIVGATAGPVPRGYRHSGELDPEARTTLFCERVDDYRADVVRISAADIETAVAAECVARAVETLVVPPGLSWRPPGVEITVDDGLGARELDRVGGVLTGCTVAVAETGTIMLSGGESEGRRALTLIPDLHICVVLESQICELVPEALARLEPQRPITFISGPSATSDIELNRVEGVHGPRTLVVLVAKEER
jgi:L-lactate dehydrogenase complex protein LldG